MKFGNLLKKEIKELLSPQAIFSMLFTCFLFIALGQVMEATIQKSIKNTTVNMIIEDDSEFTTTMINNLDSYGVTPKIISCNLKGEYYDFMKTNELTTLVIIPAGFGEQVVNGNEAASINCISLINSGGLSSTISSTSSANLTTSISKYVSDYIEKEKLNISESEIKLIKNPIVNVEYTAANGKTLQVSPEVLMSLVTAQSVVTPMAIFFLITMAAQMIMTAVSTEKIDKTLETLMSAPVSRLTVLVSKMTAALIVAILNALCTMIGYAFYFKGMLAGDVQNLTAEVSELGTATAANNTVNIAEVMNGFGMTLTPQQYLIFGLEIFLTVAIGLSLALILGAMATDAKSVQTLVIPISTATMIPFLVTVFTDINTLSPAVKAIIYLIPFTHTYTAMENMMFGNMGLVIGGLIYQVIFFIACMYFAIKVFTSDLLFTLNLSFLNKKKSHSNI